MENRKNNFKCFLSKIEKLFCFIGLFFSIYSVKFSFFPIHSSHLFFIVFIIWFAYDLSFKLGYSVKELKQLFLVISLFLFSFFYTSLSYILQQPESLDFLISSVIPIFAVFSGFIIAKKISSCKNNSFLSLLWFISSAICLQGIFIILSYVSPTFSEFVASILPLGGNFEDEAIFRARGLTHASGAWLSVVQALGLLIVSYLFPRLTGVKDIIISASMSVVILFSIFLTGRTGLLIFPVCLFQIFEGIRKKRSLEKIKIIFLSMLIFFMIFVFISWQIYSTEAVIGNKPVWLKTLEWFLEAFWSGSNGQTGIELWKQTFAKHLVLPSEQEVWVWGRQDLDLTIRQGTDMGYLRNWFGRGLIGAILYYLPYFSSLLILPLNNENRLERFFLFLVGTWILFAEIKEPFLRLPSFNIIIFVLFFFPLLRKRTIRVFHKNEHTVSS